MSAKHTLNLKREEQLKPMVGFIRNAKVIRAPDDHGYHANPAYIEVKLSQ